MIPTYSVIEVLVDVPLLGVKVGARGVVLDRYETPYPAYEIEFLDEQGETVGCLAMKPGDVRQVAASATRLAA